MINRDVLMLDVDPDCTLMEAWNALYVDLVRVGAGQSQVEAMKTVYFMGAAHAWGRTHKAVLSGPRVFNAIMHELYDDIESAMGPSGNA